MLRLKPLTILTFLSLAACSTPYGPAGGMGAGGYTDRAIDSSSYFIRYQMSQQDAMLASTDLLTPLWKKRAAELCESNDFYYETDLKKVDDQGKVDPLAAPSLFGIAFCNNKIQDTRFKAPDAEFLSLQSIPPEAFAIKEANGLWDLLSNARFDQLESALTALYADSTSGKAPVTAFRNQTESLVRLGPSTEALLDAWIKAKPDSVFGHWARARYYIELGWHKRGSGYWNQVQRQAQDEFVFLLGKARKDLDLAIARNGDFCEAQRLRIDIAKNGRAGYTRTTAELFDDSVKVCQDYLPLYSTYLMSLQPQWNGSYDQMKSFVSRHSQRAAINPLKAWMYAYDGDVAFGQGKYDNALASYELAISQFPAPRFFTGKARALEAKERFVESVENYARAVELAPYDADSYEGLSRTLAKQSRFLDALVASFYVSRSNAFSASPFYFQGNVFYEMRRYNDALVSYESALVLEPEKAFLMHRKRAAEYQIQIRAKDNGSAPLKTAI